MRRQAHLLIAFVVSILILYFSLRLNLIASWFTGWPLIIVALFSTTLPDMLEPGKNIHHRKFFHSKKVFSLLSVGIIASLGLILLGKSSYYFYALFFFLGYWLHLLADMATSRLPK